MMKIGANVSISDKGLLSAVEESVSYGASTFMIYTRSNRNPRQGRKMDEFYIEEAYELMKENGMDIKDAVVHAPYTINLGGKDSTQRMGIEILKEEIQRTAALGIQYLVFHPGAHVGQGEEVAIQKIADALNEILTEEQTVFVCLETMAGDGSKVGNSLEQIAQIIEKVTLKNKLGVCTDTCHNFSQGYDIVNDFDGFLQEFDRIIGLDFLRVVHVNGSKFPLGAKKDRHANLGAEDDHIGKEALRAICNHPLLQGMPKILETPIGQYANEIDYIKGNDKAVLSPKSLK